MIEARPERRPDGRDAEGGYLMVAVTVAVAVLVIGSLVTYQAFEDMVHREREAEMMFRAQEIARAIQRYRKANGTSPDKLEKLMEPGPAGQYFMRRLYEDPLVKDGKWGLLLLGPGGQIIDPSGTSGIPGFPGSGGPGGDDATGTGNNGIGGAANDSNFSSGQAQVGQQQAGQLGGVGNRDSKLSPGGGAGGLPIAGVKTLSDLQAFRVYKGLEDYAMWQFTYLDVEQRQLALAGAKGKRPTRSIGGGLTPRTGGTGNTPGGSNQN